MFLNAFEILPDLEMQVNPFSAQIFNKEQYMNRIPLE